PLGRRAHPGPDSQLRPGPRRGPVRPRRGHRRAARRRRAHQPAGEEHRGPRRRRRTWRRRAGREAWTPSSGGAMSAATVSPWPLDTPVSTIRPKSRIGTRAGRRFVAAAIAGVVLSGLFIAWTALRIGGDTVTVGVDDIGEAVAALLAALSCGYAAWRSPGRMRLAWGLLGGSALSWFIGEVIWSVYEVGLGVNVPFPTAADAGYLVAIPLAVAGMLAFPSAPGRLTTRSQALVDGAIVALSLVFVSWALGLGKVYATSSDQPLAQLLGAAYPASDIVIIAVLLLVIRRANPQQRGSMFLLLGGLAANSVADSAFAFLNAAGTYGAIGSVLDAGWVVGYLMVALAPLWPAPFAGAVGEEGPVDFWQMSVPWGSLLHAPARIMVGSMVADYLSAEELSRLIERSKPLWEGEVDTVEGDSPTRRADGSEVWLHWSVTSVRSSNGKIDYFLAMFEDI